MLEPMSMPCSADRPASRLRLLILAYLLMYPLPWLARAPTGGGLAASAAGIALFLALYFRVWNVSGWRRLPFAAGMLAIGFALQPFGGVWSVFAVYAATTAGFTRPGRVGALGVTLMLLALALFGLGFELSPWEWLPGVFFGAIAGCSATFVGAIAARNTALAEAREESRRLAVTAERERIARDLHDVLGHTLTVVAVKADLARKLLDRDVPAVRRELDEIHATVRAALADVRIAVSGMRSTTLAQELDEARRALASAGISLESAANAGDLPPLIETALAFVVREAATNVIRHSGARSCRITLSREGAEAALEIADDGHGGGVVEGNGLTGMRQRLAGIRGVLELGGNSGMRVRVRVPLAEQPA
jgi:two-component system sensor histidine kinase DesK